ncbi:MAG: hypothetical protein AVDCRST_MAG89-2615, partial [uncultured Gemmatimonadetes bacterium]
CTLRRRRHPRKNARGRSVLFGGLRRIPQLPSPPAPLPQAGEGRIRLRFGRPAPHAHLSSRGAATPHLAVHRRRQRPRDPPHTPRHARNSHAAASSATAVSHGGRGDGGRFRRS